MANIFDRFNQGFGSFLTPNPPPTNSYIDSLMLDDSLKALIQQQQEVQRQNMGNMFRTGLGTALLEMGAPRTTPGLDLTPLSRIIGSINQAAQTQSGMGNVFDMPMKALQYQTMQRQFQSTEPLTTEEMVSFNPDSIKFEGIDAYGDELKKLRSTILATKPNNQQAATFIENIDKRLTNIDSIKSTQTSLGKYFNKLSDEDYFNLIKSPVDTKIFIEKAKLSADEEKSLPGTLFTQSFKTFSPFVDEINSGLMNDSTKNQYAGHVTNIFSLDAKVKAEQNAYERQVANNKTDMVITEPQTLINAKKALQDEKDKFLNVIRGKVPLVETKSGDGINQFRQEPEQVTETTSEDVQETAQKTEVEQKIEPTTIKQNKSFYEDEDEQKIADQSNVNDKIIDYDKAAFNYIKKRNPNLQDNQIRGGTSLMADNIRKETVLARKSVLKADAEIAAIDALLEDEKAIKSFTIGDVPTLKDTESFFLKIPRAGIVLSEQLFQERFLKERRSNFRSAIKKIINTNFFNVLAAMKEQSKTGATGMGNLSESEGARFDQLIGNLEGFIDGGEEIIPTYETVVQNLNDLKRILNENKEKIKELYKIQYGQELI